eukprot:COSAG02_NODE_1127_length_14428_cov_68.304627_15_plen_84_part_00
MVDAEMEPAAREVMASIGHQLGVLGPSREPGMSGFATSRDPAGNRESGNERFWSIVGPNWEPGIGDFIAWRGLLGGHLGNQKH